MNEEKLKEQLERELLKERAMKLLNVNFEWAIWFCQLCEDEKVTIPMLELGLIQLCKHLRRD